MPLLAGRPTVVVPLLVSLTLLFLIFHSHSHPPSTTLPQRPNVVHSFHRRKATLEISTVTTTTTSKFITTTPITITASPFSSSARSSSGSLSISASKTSGSSSFSLSTPLSSTFSRSRSTTHTSSSRTPSSSSFVSTTSKTLILKPTSLTESFPTPATTFTSTDDISPSASPSTSDSQPPPPSASATPEEAASSRFWNNKGAVGGTFAVVGLVIFGIIAVLIITCVRCLKNHRARNLDKEPFRNFFDPEHSRQASGSDVHSLNHPIMDPFAAGEVVQVPGSSASVHTSGLVATGPPAHSTGYNGSDDDHTSSHGHASNHHGFSSISYRTGLSDSRGNLAQPESQFFYQPQKPAPPVLSPQLHPYNATPNAMAVPLPATMSSSTYTMSSPYQVGVGQAHNIRQADLDANYYAGQIHYDAGAIAPTRSAGYAV